MAEFTLHCFAESGNAYKAALMLQLCGADWRPHRIAFFGGETRSLDFRGVNVMGEAPVLVHHRSDGDFTLSQSGAILTYLARHFGRFGHESEREEFEILRWVLFDNHKLSSYTATARFMRHFRGKADDPAAVSSTSGQSTPGRSLRRTLPVATGSPRRVPPSPTCRCAATCSGPTRSGRTGTTTPRSPAGCSASAIFPAGRRPRR